MYLGNRRYVPRGGGQRPVETVLNFVGEAHNTMSRNDRRNLKRTQRATDSAAIRYYGLLRALLVALKGTAYLSDGALQFEV